MYIFFLYILLSIYTFCTKSSTLTVFHMSVQQEKRLFTKFHRQLFCWLDKWVDLTMDDIRRMEEETQKELDEVTKDCILHTCCRTEQYCFVAIHIY